MEIQDIRRKRLAQLIEEKFDGSQAKFVEHTGENQGEVSALLRNKSFGERKARKIEAKCGLETYWLDNFELPEAQPMKIVRNLRLEQSVLAKARAARLAASGDQVVAPEWMALIHVTQRELDLLTHYRSASDIGKSLIETAAESAASETSASDSAHQS